MYMQILFKLLYMICIEIDIQYCLGDIKVSAGFWTKVLGGQAENPLDVVEALPVSGKGPAVSINRAYLSSSCNMFEVFLGLNDMKWKYTWITHEDNLLGDGVTIWCAFRKIGADACFHTWSYIS